MKKNDKHEKRPRRSETGSTDTRRDWRPMLRRLHDAIEWALDIAVTLAGDLEEDVQAIERTREYARAWIQGRRVTFDIEDVLTTLAILFAAIVPGRDDDDARNLEALRQRERMLYLPGPFELPRVVLRRVPRFRNASAHALTQLAA